MCAALRTTLSPEMALIAERIPSTHRDPALLSALRDEYGGSSVEWILANGPVLDAARSSIRRRSVSLWTRIFGTTSVPNRAEGPRTPVADSTRRAVGPGPCSREAAGHL
jgi:hypothetical protein